MYNLTNLTSAKNIIEISTAMNNLSGGALYGFFFLALFLFNMALYSKIEFNKLLLLNSFILSVVGIFMMSLGYISMSLLMIPILMTVVSIFLIVFMR